jgi:fibronectin-binding autotransporter adhesin
MNTYARPSTGLCATAVARLSAVFLAVLLMFCLASTTAVAQCTLTGTVSTWTDGNSNWLNATNWNNGVPNSTTSACITDGTSTVTLDANQTLSTLDLQIGSGNTLTSGTNVELNVFGTQIINNGQFVLNGGNGANAVLQLENNVTLSGTGALTLTVAGGGGSAYIELGVSGVTLTNQSTIQGTGVIGNNGLSLINSGTVDANVSGQALNLVSMSSGINNTGGLLRASNGGILAINGITVFGGGTITARTGGIVQLFGNTTIQGGTLNNIGGTLGTPLNSNATLDGSTGGGAITINGTYTNDVNADTTLLGTINNKNNFQVNGGAGANAVVSIGSNVTLQGGGTVTLSTASGGGAAYIEQSVGGLTLTNVNNTIQGAGVIGNNGMSLVNEATVNANVSGQALILEGMSGALTNTGLLEASNAGILQINGVTVNNAGGGKITANAGSTVQLYGSTVIQGGTLTNNGSFFGTPINSVVYLDGSTAAGPITINGTYTSDLNSDTHLLGTINNKNNFQLNGGAGTNAIILADNNVTLQGGGTVTMSTASGGGAAYIEQASGGLTLTNVNNLIQGAGVIGNNGLTLVNQATVNANVSGEALILEGMSGGLTNTGILEASNGGILQINGVTVNNAGGGTITANAGTTVQLYGSTVIQGGILTNNDSFFGTPINSVAYLDGSTGAGAITIHGTYTSDRNSDTHLLGTINNNNNFQLNAGSGVDSILYVDTSNVTLQGGGTVTLSTLNGGGDAVLQQASGGLTLTNVDNTIQGDGILGNNGLTIINQATINANSNGGAELTALFIQGAAVTNTGLIEATNSGVLNISGVTVNNAGGTISANGGGASVQLYGNTQIQGGTLTNNGGAFFGTPTGNTAILDGSTGAGAVTINGTYTSDLNSTTDLLGTINNHGNVLVNGGGGTNTVLLVETANMMLQGGGTVTLSTAGGGGSAYIYQSAGGLTLENFDNTIQGAGIIGNNGLSLLNDTGGTVLANAAGQTLSITGATTVTNDGTFQANSGSGLLVGSVTSFTNFSGNTLTGGSYNVYGTLANPGTLQINPLGTTGGEIVNNAATILLNGPNSNFYDASSLDALSNFSNNTGTGSFTIQAGRNFTSPSSFANAGAVNVGAGSTFTTGGSGNYNQSAGSTKVDGALTAGGGHVNINGGTLLGNGGTITGNVSMSGTLSPGDTPAAAGALSIAGSYAQLAAGIFQLDLGGLTAGSQFDLLNVSGTTNLTGTLDVSLINGFFPAVGNTFTFITSGGLVSGVFSTLNGLNIGGGEMLQVIYNANSVEISTISLGPLNDFWNGGTGVWSNGSQWSLGTSPGINNNAFIYSGGNDLVTLDIGSGSVNQLSVGGASNGFTSELTDGRTAQNLTIIQGLSVGANGFLDLTGASTVTAATMGNSGHVFVGTGATLSLTSQPAGITDAVAGSQFDLWGTFTAGAANGFAQLNSIEGAVNLFGQNFTDTPGSGTLTISSTGALTANAGTTLSIHGNVDNSGSVSTDPGGNTLTVSGTMTNSGTFQLNGPGDKATMAGLTNNSGGFVDVEGGSTFQVNGNVTNSGNIYTSFNGTGGNTFNVTGTLNNTNFFGMESTDTATIGGAVTNSGSFQLTGGAMATFSSSLMNSGTVDLENASTLKINGTADNFGTLSTSANGGSGGNTLTVSGLLTNEATGTLSVNGPSDVLKASAGLVNQGLVTVKNGSTIDPPFVNNLGTINIDGTSTFVVGTGTATGPGFIQLSNGTFGEMINSATAFGQLNVAGSASLNGTLDILLKSGYNPAVGTSFTFLLLNPGQLSGTYATILNDIFNGGTEKWIVNYNDAGGFVSLTAAMNVSTTPEPGTFLLLGSGLLSIAYGVRRRWLK